MKASARSITVTRGDTRVEVIFRGSRRPMSRRDLHVALEPIFRAWIRAACSWDGAPIGDYKFVVFMLDVTPEVQVYVQFWSEPLEPVLWEVSSGRWNPPADEWLAGDRARRIEAMGFAIGGEAENYQREVEVDSAADVAALTKAVVRIFREGFDYRGTRPIRAQLVHEGRSETKPTYDAFTPEDVAKVFAGIGYRVAAADSDEDEDEPATIRCRKRGVETLVEFDEPAEGGNVYRRVRFSADVPLPDEERERLKNLPGPPRTRSRSPPPRSSMRSAAGSRSTGWSRGSATGRRRWRRGGVPQGHGGGRRARWCGRRCTEPARAASGFKARRGQSSRTARGSVRGYDDQSRLPAESIAGPEAATLIRLLCRCAAASSVCRICASGGPLPRGVEPGLGLDSRCARWRGEYGWCSRQSPGAPMRRRQSDGTRITGRELAAVNRLARVPAARRGASLQGPRPHRSRTPRAAA